MHNQIKVVPLAQPLTEAEYGLPLMKKDKELERELDDLL
jgi:hypothetical protein